MPRLAKITHILIPPCYVGSVVDGSYSILRAIEARVIPKAGRKNREPRAVVIVQAWSPGLRRWLDAPIGLAIVRSGFLLCPNALAALDVPPGSWYAWRSQGAASDARGSARNGGSRRRSRARTGDDAGESPGERSLESPPPAVPRLISGSTSSRGSAFEPG